LVNVSWRKGEVIDAEVRDSRTEVRFLVKQVSGVALIALFKEKKEKPRS
jgi:hypothetical protein